MNRHPLLAGIAFGLLGTMLVGTFGTADARPVRTRGGAHSSVNRAPHGNVNRGTASNRNVNRNVNRNANVNVNRNVDVHVDGDRGWDDHYHYHPVATAAAVTATVAVTSAVVGSIVSSPPSTGCVTTIANGISYTQCGNTWYQPQYQGSQVSYVVVNPPY